MPATSHPLRSLALPLMLAAGALCIVIGHAGPLAGAPPLAERPKREPMAALAQTEPKSDQSQFSAIPGTYSVRRDPDGLFRVSLRVNNVATRFIVDTGATTTVLTGRDADRAGVVPSRNGHDLIATAAGPSPMRWARLDRVEIGGARISGVEAAVVDRGLATSLLGQNILRRLGVVTFKGDEMTIR